MAIRLHVDDAFAGAFLTSGVHAALRTFIFLSGMSIGLRYTSFFEKITKNTLINYVRARIKSIVPLYVFIVLWILYNNYGGINGNDLLSLITFRVEPGIQLQSAAYLWFVSSLMQLYCIAPFLLFSLGTLQNATQLSNRFILIFFVIISFIMHYFFLANMSYTFNYSSSIALLDTFILGILFARLYMHSMKRNFKVWEYSVVFVLLSIYVLIWITFSTQIFPSYFDLIGNTFVGVYFPFITTIIVALVLLVTKNIQNVIQNSYFLHNPLVVLVRNVFMLLGKNSFAIYLIHDQLFQPILALSEVNTYATSYFIVLVLVTFLSLVLSLLFTHGMNYVADRRK